MAVQSPLAPPGAGALVGALSRGPERFDPIGWNVAPNVLAARGRDGLALDAIPEMSALAPSL